MKQNNSYGTFSFLENKNYGPLLLGDSGNHLLSTKSLKTNFAECISLRTTAKLL